MGMGSGLLMVRLDHSLGWKAIKMRPRYAEVVDLRQPASNPNAAKHQRWKLGALSCTGFPLPTASSGMGDVGR
jgi:hypothetical protein